MATAPDILFHRYFQQLPAISERSIVGRKTSISSNSRCRVYFEAFRRI